MPTGSSPDNRIRVLIVDDHAVVRQGLVSLLGLHDDIDVVGEAADGAEAVDVVAATLPDVVLMDLVMPKMDGIEATRRTRAVSPTTRILVLSSFGEDEKVFPAIKAGASGYLLKDVSPQSLVQAVRAAANDEVHLHPEIARKLLQEVGREPKPAAARDLTERERDVLGLIAQGRNNRDIAEALVLSEKTVKTHVSNILSKLHLEDRTQAAVYALRKGLASLE